MSTFALLTELTTDSLDKVTFLPERCLRKRLNRSDCAKCVNACPAEALSFIDDQVRHDTQKCTGCMLCSACCPNDAFEVKGCDLETRIQSLTTGEDIIISCYRETQIHPDELVVPCLGGLSIIHLLVLCLNRSGKIIFNISACDGCENKAAADHFETQVASLKKISSDLIETELIALKTAAEIISSKVAEHRRSFLRGMKNSLVSAVESRLPTFNIHSSDGESRHRRIPIKVKLVRDLLKQLDQKKRDLVSALCLPTFQVSEKCSVCPLCKGICPTGAIQIDKVDKDKTLAIDNTLCSGCGLCVTFCKKDALRLHQAMVQI